MPPHQTRAICIYHAARTICNVTLNELPPSPHPSLIPPRPLLTPSPHPPPPLPKPPHKLSHFPLPNLSSIPTPTTTPIPANHETLLQSSAPLPPFPLRPPQPLVQVLRPPRGELLVHLRLLGAPLSFERAELQQFGLGGGAVGEEGVVGVEDVGSEGVGLGNVGGERGRGEERVGLYEGVEEGGVVEG